MGWDPSPRHFVVTAGRRARRTPARGHPATSPPLLSLQPPACKSVEAGVEGRPMGGPLRVPFVLPRPGFSKVSGRELRACPSLRSGLSSLARFDVWLQYRRQPAKVFPDGL